MYFAVAVPVFIVVFLITYRLCREEARTSLDRVILLMGTTMIAFLFSIMWIIFVPLSIVGGLIYVARYHIYAVTDYVSEILDKILRIN